MSLVAPTDKNVTLPSLNLLLAQTSGTLRKHRKDLRAREAAVGPDAQGITPLHHAAAQGDVGEIRRLLRAGAEVDRQNLAQGQTALHLAACCGDLTSAQALVHAGAKIDLIDNAGNTPLLVAVRFGQVGVAGMLLRRGTDTNKANKDGNTPLLLACRSNLGAQFVKRLLHFKANPNMGTADGFTPLHIAAGAGQMDVVSALRKGGAQVNLETGRGETALLLASRNGHAAAVQAFISASGDDVDCDINAVPSIGESPLQAAARSGHRAVVEELLRAGANVMFKPHQQPVCVRPRRQYFVHQYKGHQYEAAVDCENQYEAVPVPPSDGLS